MNNKFFILITLIFIISLISVSNINAQKCAKKTYCSDDDMGDFDYRSQSHYSEMTSGETQRVEIIVYANQTYRLLICPDPKIGNIEYKIFNLTKKPKRVMQDFYQKEVTVYKQAENGEYEHDENGELIVLGTQVVNDTIWQRKTVENEELIFDSKSISFKPPYWETKTIKTGMLVIEVSVDENEVPATRCVNVLVGRKTEKVRNIGR